MCHYFSEILQSFASHAIGPQAMQLDEFHDATGCYVHGHDEPQLSHDDQAGEEEE